MAVVVGAIVLAGSGAGAAIAAITSATPDLSISQTKAASVSSSLASEFRVLGRPYSAADALPTGLAQALGTGAGSHFGANPELAREVTAPDGTRMWLVPGTTGMCLQLANGGGVCTPTDKLDSEGIEITLVPVDGGPQTTEGLAPSRATVTILSSVTSGAGSTTTATNGASGTVETVPASTTVQATDIGTDNTFSVTSAQAGGYSIQTSTGTFVEPFGPGR